MGRGRAKAKQTRVARQLKYSSGTGTDLDRLAQELAAERGDSAWSAAEESDDESEDHAYDEDEDEDDE
jgi:hypothetical protein